MNRVEIFKTNIQTRSEAEQVLNTLKLMLPSARMNFDLDDPDSVLRIENFYSDSNVIVQSLQRQGFLCKVIPDKVWDKSNTSTEEMRDFWEASFDAYQAMWGLNPTNSAIYSKNLFIEKDIQDILIPGIGYGRNAQYFVENGLNVTGIEISRLAIDLARRQYNLHSQIFHGSVTDMPFDDHLYEGIFCHAVLHLLNQEQRVKMISDCYSQLKDGGYMIFVVVSKKSSNYGKGKEVAPDTFEIGKGAQIFFYQDKTVVKDFQEYGLTNFFELEEPNTAASNGSSSTFILIICQKQISSLV